MPTPGKAVGRRRSPTRGCGARFRGGFGTHGGHRRPPTGLLRPAGDCKGGPGAGTIPTHAQVARGGRFAAQLAMRHDALRKCRFQRKKRPFFGPERPSRRRAVGALGRDWSGQMGGGAGSAWGHPGRVFGRRQPTTQGRGMCRWGWFWRTGRPPAAFCGPIRTGLRSHSGAQGKDQPFACMGIQGWAAGCPAGDGMWVNANGLRTLKSVIF